MIDVVVDETLDGIFEAPENIERAVLAACAAAGVSGVEPEMCIRFASDAEVQSLNRQWRQKDALTDVLSFPMQEPPCDLSEPLGDVALAVPFIVKEAERLGLPSQHHSLHLIVHATLHLLGFDHIHDDESDLMQSMEQQAMAALGLHDPYVEKP